MNNMPVYVGNGLHIGASNIISVEYIAEHYTEVHYYNEHRVATTRRLTELPIATIVSNWKVACGAPITNPPNSSWPA